jgi:hypothetical protein
LEADFTLNQHVTNVLWLKVAPLDQEVAAMCKLILQNIIILWNYTALTKLIIRSNEARQIEILENLKQGSILAWGHANLLGLYDFRDLHSKNDDDISGQQIMEFSLPMNSELGKDQQNMWQLAEA